MTLDQAIELLIVLAMGDLSAQKKDYARDCKLVAAALNLIKKEREGYTFEDIVGFTQRQNNMN